MKPERPQVTILPDGGPAPISTVGPLRSVQVAQIEATPELLDALCRTEAMERLARAYWRFLERRSLGLLRVVYGPGWRSIVLLWRRLTLLRFGTPRYDSGPGFARVTWPIERGVLVARRGRGRGYLRFDLRRAAGSGAGNRAVIRAEVASFYPWLRGSGRFARLGALLYGQTQARLHVWVTRGFLRSLEALEADPPPRGAAPAPRGC